PLLSPRSLHDALPISELSSERDCVTRTARQLRNRGGSNFCFALLPRRLVSDGSLRVELVQQDSRDVVGANRLCDASDLNVAHRTDRKSTRLNSSHSQI